MHRTVRPRGPDGVDCQKQLFLITVQAPCETRTGSQFFKVILSRVFDHLTKYAPICGWSHERWGYPIKAWLAERARIKPPCRTFFVSQKLKALDRRTAWLTIRKYGDLAGLELPTHPHQLRHACGFAQADQGADTRLIQDYLGHRDIRHTVIYTATNPARFERLWR